MLFFCCGAVQDLEVAIQHSGKTMTLACKQEGFLKADLIAGGSYLLSVFETIRVL